VSVNKHFMPSRMNGAVEGGVLLDRIEGHE
jgi:hypothetical protein